MSFKQSLFIQYESSEQTTQVESFIESICSIFAKENHSYSNKSNLIHLYEYEVSINSFSLSEELLLKIPSIKAASSQFIRSLIIFNVLNYVSVNHFLFVFKTISSSIRSIKHLGNNLLIDFEDHQSAKAFIRSFNSIDFTLIQSIQSKEHSLDVKWAELNKDYINDFFLETNCVLIENINFTKTIFESNILFFKSFLENFLGKIKILKIYASKVFIETFENINPSVFENGLLLNGKNCPVIPAMTPLFNIDKYRDNILKANPLYLSNQDKDIVNSIITNESRKENEMYKQKALNAFNKLMKEEQVTVGSSGGGIHGENGKFYGKRERDVERDRDRDRDRGESYRERRNGNGVNRVEERGELRPKVEESSSAIPSNVASNTNTGLEKLLGLIGGSGVNIQNLMSLSSVLTNPNLASTLQTLIGAIGGGSTTQPQTSFPPLTNQNPPNNISTTVQNPIPNIITPTPNTLQRPTQLQQNSTMPYTLTQATPDMLSQMYYSNPPYNLATNTQLYQQSLPLNQATAESLMDKTSAEQQFANMSVDQQLTMMKRYYEYLAGNK